MQYLLAPGDSNTKLAKSSGRGWLTAGLSLAPHNSAGAGNVCPHATAGCIASCLDHQGRAAIWEMIGEARRAKTRLFYDDRKLFMSILRKDLERFQRKAEKLELELAVRLNVFSDLPWEKLAPWIFREFPDVQFYDYTKNPRRSGQLRDNYWLTLSRSETNDRACVGALSQGNNVAVVFARELPAVWNGFPVFNGDETDLRFADPRGHVIGLKLKAHSLAERERAESSGFVVVTK